MQIKHKPVLYSLLVTSIALSSTEFLCYKNTERKKEENLERGGHGHGPVSFIWEPWILVWRWHYTFIPIEQNSSWERPSFSESENFWIFLEKHLCLNIPSFSWCEYQIIVELYPPKHPCVIFRKHNKTSLSLKKHISESVWCTIFTITSERNASLMTKKGFQ